MDNRHQAIKEQLHLLATEKHQQFQSKLTPGVTDILGVPLPQLRALAKTIAKEDWTDYLGSAHDDSFEEIMLQGLVIGYGTGTIDQLLHHTANFIPKISNWAVCDSFCSSLKWTQKYPEQVWAFLQPYSHSAQAYDLRFAIVMMLNYYLDDAHIETVLQKLNTLKHDHYYVNMATAWALSKCFVKYPDQTMALLQDNQLDHFTYHKTLQKIIESHCVDDETKQLIRQMKQAK